MRAVPHPTASLDATEGPFLQYPAAARVAQVVEHATENRGVGGSTPPPGTTFQRQHRSLKNRERTSLHYEGNRNLFVLDNSSG